MERQIDINEFDYPLPDERIAKFPVGKRDTSKLLVYDNGTVSGHVFTDLGDFVPKSSLLIFNNTRVVRARLLMHKASGARIEVFCLEPHNPADYEHAFTAKERCEWSCIVGNLKRWKEGTVSIEFEYDGQSCTLEAQIAERGSREHIVRFSWNADCTFGQLLEHLGRIPIPPYLNRDSEEIDNTRYQTVYAKMEGSVAAPTAGLHFTDNLISEMKKKGFSFSEVTLHVGAGTFLPVKDENAAKHPMHTEHFEISLSTLKALKENFGRITAVGTTSVRTLESLPAIAYRIHVSDDPRLETSIGQWEPYDIPKNYNGVAALEDLIGYMDAHALERIKASTRIMITPLGFRFRIVSNIITNFHQPKSTLLLLVSAYLNGDWKKVYDFALRNSFRFLSYGDSSLLMNNSWPIP